MLLEQQVLRGISGDDELGEEDQLGTGAHGLLEAVTDFGLVAEDVTNGGVKLTKGEP
jgi:hypothetical protein